MEAAGESERHQPTGPGWSALRPAPGTPWGATAKHLTLEVEPTSSVAQFLADGGTRWHPSSAESFR